MPDKRTSRQRTGDIGENIACEFLVKRGFRVVERNYLRKWGEIDIIAEKSGILHFVEVKSVAHATREGVSDMYRPEENMHPGKLRRLSRVIQTYLLENREDREWQLDLVTVRLDMQNRIGHCEIVENIIM